jgi:hypothetical protein
MTADSKARTVFALLNAGLMHSNPALGMKVCVCLSCVCVVLCVGGGLSMGKSSIQRVLPALYRIQKLKKRPWPKKIAKEP